MDIPFILDRIRPGAAWGWLGEDKGDYANLDWRDKIQAKPSKKEVEAAWPAAETELARQIETETKIAAARAELEKIDMSTGAIALTGQQLAALVTLVRSLQ